MADWSTVYWCWNIKPTGKSVQFTAILSIFVFKEGTRLPMHTRCLHAVHIIYLPYVGGSVQLLYTKDA